MKTDDKLLLRALRGETLAIPPVWMMRQAGRYLPEYKATRSKAGDFLSLCYNPDLATEVTLQPIRRYGFDGAILFADILLVPQALGADLWFEPGEGPRLSVIEKKSDFNKLSQAEDIHETLSPIYQTIKNLRESLPKETALIGFAGAPWTVATYMIAGRGTIDQAPALNMMKKQPSLFDALIDRITEATIEYLLYQIKAGAEVIKLFDSWAGTLSGFQFPKYSTRPAARIVKALREEFPNIPLIGFPKGATESGYVNYAKETDMECLAIDAGTDAVWAVENLQTITCVQGNLDQSLLVTGGEKLISETKRIKDIFSNGPHIFNLGHGITPDADPNNVDVMLKALRG